MTTEFGLRIRAARKHAGLTQKELARAVGISQPSLSEAEASGFSSAYTAQIAAACGVSALWLATGDGNMTDGVSFRPITMRPPSSGGEEAAENVVGVVATRGRVPLISFSEASALARGETPKTGPAAERWLDCPVEHGPGTFALRVKGTSMEAPYGRSYPEGCIIYVDPRRREPKDGDRILALLASTGEVTFKVYKAEDGARWLAPLNPSHLPIRDPFEIVGTVIGKWEDE